MAIVRRAATAADQAFARGAHHRAFRDLVERRFGTWSEEQQDQYFASSWAACPPEIILFDGEPCGYVCVEDRAADGPRARVSDGSRLPESGDRHAVLGELIEHARARGVPLRLRTQLLNRAANLYRRVGFRQVGTTATHRLFEWTASE